MLDLLLVLILLYVVCISVSFFCASLLREEDEKVERDYSQPCLGLTLAFDPDFGKAAAFAGLAGLNPCAILTQRYTRR